LCDLFLFTAPATTSPYTLSLHDALPIFPARTLPASSAPPSIMTLTTPRDAKSLSAASGSMRPSADGCARSTSTPRSTSSASADRSEEHTSELQSQSNLVCRLLLEKKKKK